MMHVDEHVLTATGNDTPSPVGYTQRATVADKLGACMDSAMCTLACSAALDRSMAQSRA